MPALFSMNLSANISRRVFLTLATGAVIATRQLFAAIEVPILLDHILLGSPDLQTGIDFVEKHIGVRATFGGVHPGRGTQNALLSLGERRYLEIIAPDPAQPGVKNPIASNLHSLTEPRLVGWAAHPGNLASFSEKLKAAHIDFHGPAPGSRKRPDGRLLQWQTVNLADDAGGLLPFFIEWAADCPHPSTDAPTGCRVMHFELATPNPEALKRATALLGLDVLIRNVAIHNQKPQIRTILGGPNGQLGLGS